MNGLAPGVRLGPYEIVSRLGAGGMGEVWRASDTRLDRHVAVKVLPPELAKNAQFQARFEREARAVSRLNHSNICTLHDIGETDGINYLVMELLEGESLADRLTRGPLPPSDVLRYGAQIAEALSVAHRAGIVHRDLKPGNIMITRSGAKLLDFGLARSASAVVQTSSPDDATVAATNKPLTTEGTIVGTFQYMAPEQLEGHDADARTDIFALGAVLYEMTTGRRAFSGQSRTSLIASIVAADPPPVRTIQPLASPTLEHIISKALAKDPDERWQSAHDVAAELRWAVDSQPQSEGTLAAPTVARRRRREAMLTALLAIALAAAAAIASLYYRQAQRANRVVVTDLGAPQGMHLNNVGDNAGPPTLSPDGRRIVYSVEGEGPTRLWLRDLTTGESKPLTGTEDATFPFWSDDSRHIGFFSSGWLRRTDIGGGAPIALAQVIAARGGTWAGDTILFTLSGLGSIARIPAAGGAAVSITRLDHNHFTSHRWPWFLPDGKHFLFLAGNHQDGSGSSNAIYLGSLEGGEPKLVMKTTSSAIWAGGYLLTVRDSNLVAQKMSADGTLDGEPKVVAAGVLNDLGTWRSGISASARGDLAFGYGQGSLRTTVDWVDRTGKTIEVIAEGDRFWDVQLSPDQKKLALTLGDPSRQLWLYDLARKTRTRLETDAKWAGLPAWTPDSSAVLANIIRTEGFSFLLKPIDGSPSRELVKAVDPSLTSGLGSSVSADGQSWVYAPDGSLWMAPLRGPGKPVRMTPPAWRAHDPHYSPDGKWLAFVTAENERDDVVIAPAGDPTRKLQVSDTGGSRPAWRPDGRELYYVDAQGRVTALPVQGDGSSPELGPPQKLFTLQGASIVRPYCAAVDGQRFAIVRVTGSDSVPVRLMTNWKHAMR